MGKVEININPQVLQRARETVALSLTAAAEKIGISVKRLSQLEEGDTQPSLNELKAISKVYKRTIVRLLLKQPPEESPCLQTCLPLIQNQLIYSSQLTLMYM